MGHNKKKFNDVDICHTPYDSSGARFHEDLYRKMINNDGVEGLQTRERVNEILTLIGDLKEAKVLDIGAGIGLFSLEVAKKGGKVTGMDSSSDMLRTAKKVADEQNVIIDYRQAAAPFLPFEDSIFDIVILGDLVEHLVPEVLLHTIKECHRILKPKGILAIHTAPSKYHYLFLVSWKFNLIALPILYLPLPEIIIKEYLDVMYKLYMIYEKFMTKKVKSIAENDYGHINCQTQLELKRLLKESTFRIESIYSKEIFIKNKKYFNRIPFLIVPKFNKHFFQRSIFIKAICKK